MTTCQQGERPQEKPTLFLLALCCLPVSVQTIHREHLCHSLDYQLFNVPQSQGDMLHSSTLVVTRALQPNQTKGTLMSHILLLSVVSELPSWPVSGYKCEVPHIVH